jgi:hypothetical protein
VGWCLPKEVVGLEELEGDKWIVHFGPPAIAVVYAATGKLSPLPSPSTRIRKKHQANAKQEEEPYEPRRRNPKYHRCRGPRRSTVTHVPA